MKKSAKATFLAALVYIFFGASVSIATETFFPLWFHLVWLPACFFVLFKVSKKHSLAGHLNKNFVIPVSIIGSLSTLILPWVLGLGLVVSGCMLAFYFTGQPVCAA